MDQKKLQNKRYLNVPETAEYFGHRSGHTLYNRVCRSAKRPLPRQT